MSATLFWFRNDLRLADNPGLLAASQDAEQGGGLLALYVLDPQELGPDWSLGGAARWWLGQALRDLDARLQALGGRLLVAKGPADGVIARLADQASIGRLHFNRSHVPATRQRDDALSARLAGAGLRVTQHAGDLLVEPGSLRTRAGQPFKVFTPYWKAVLAEGAFEPPCAAPGRLRFAPQPEASAGLCRIDDLGLEDQTRPWTLPLAASWQVGERAAQARLADFLEQGLPGYSALRDRPDLEHVSRLSPYLRWGHLTARQIVQALSERPPAPAETPKDRSHFLSELGWREFSYEILNQFPELPQRNWRADFDAFPWQDNPQALRAWQQGRTGYPLVDAGMRQLWTQGWMHNRLRMVTASFLIKHLQIDWRQGQAWFWDTLVDADLASNAASWQWVAGSGADGAPYFRIFNPISQAQKFDPEGRFIRRHLPALQEVATPSIFEAGAQGRAPGYPAAIIDHGFARQRALDGYAQVKAAKS